MIARANLPSEDRNSESCAQVDQRIAGEDDGKSTAVASLRHSTVVQLWRQACRLQIQTLQPAPCLYNDRDDQRSTTPARSHFLHCAAVFRHTLHPKPAKDSFVWSRADRICKLRSTGTTAIRRCSWTLCDHARSYSPLCAR